MQNTSISNASVPKKLAMINDFTGFGRCSHAVAVPVVSAMGVQACPVPTAIYSNHMAFPTWHSFDYTPHIGEYLAAWEKLDLHFDGILCGFLGHPDQARVVGDFMKKQKEHGNLQIILDPVMGDHGKLYSSVNPEYFSAVRSLLSYADLITPNLTEVCFLTDTPFPQGLPDQTFLCKVADKLHRMGPSRIVITGISANGVFHNFISIAGNASSSPARSEYAVPSAGPSRPGTGDLFASILAADAVCGIPFYDSVKKAADFVRICTEGSAAAGIPICEGVCFEKYLSELIQKLR